VTVVNCPLRDPATQYTLAYGWRSCHPVDVALGREASVRYGILGPIELSDGEQLLPVGGPRQVALLALLLVHANRAISSDRLIDALWGGQGPAGALKCLHVTISRLRKTLQIAGAGGEPALRTVAGGYLLTVRPGELDAEVLQTRMQDGRRALETGDARRARDVLGEALAMWRGPALAEVAYEDWAQSEIRRGRVADGRARDLGGCRAAAR
jgi:DNA-binding SARP family transcriptional activator